MECTVIVTYRCNAHCQMCHTWQFPSKKNEEVEPSLLKKLPEELKKINISGGEPALRDDLAEIVSILRNKSRNIDISTNGYFTERLVKVGRQYPDVAFRISVEGFPELNDRLRGINNGFEKGLRTVLTLKEIGVKNVGFGIVISDTNKEDLLPLYALCSRMELEFGSSTLHNSFYFHKFNNVINDVAGTVLVIRKFIEALLTSKRRALKLRVKDWGRAYINYGLIRYVAGEKRAIACNAGKELFFLDPYAKVLACNGSDEPWIMGDLNEQTFHEIWNSSEAEVARGKVADCTKNCWMVGSARPAMRSHPWVPVLWILRNKIKLMMNRDIWQ